MKKNCLIIFLVSIFIFIPSVNASASSQFKSYDKRSNNDGNAVDYKYHSKETYEKELKQYQVENSVGVNTKLKELRAQNENLDTDLENERKKSAALEKQIKEYETNLSKSVQLLKNRAKELEQILDAEEGK